MAYCSGVGAIVTVATFLPCAAKDKPAHASKTAAPDRIFLKLILFDMLIIPTSRLEFLISVSRLQSLRHLTPTIL
jgi:hypothetical protein